MGPSKLRPRSTEHPLQPKRQLKPIVCRNNKQVLTAFHYPLTCTTYQFLLGSIFGLGWFAASGTRIDTSRSTLVAVLPLAMVHTLGNLLTNVSLGMVAVSFTHTIKALEPLFSVLFSILFLGDTPNPIVLLTLLPIMGGVIGASVTEASFNWPGFASAMMSNVTFQSRNVFSKKFMTPEIKDRVRLPACHGMGLSSTATTDNCGQLHLMLL